MTVTNGSPFLWQVPPEGDGSPDGFKRVRAYKVRPDHIVDDINRLWELLHRSGLWHDGLHADLIDGKHLSEIYTYLTTLYQPLCPRLTTLCDDGKLSLLASLLDTVPNIYAGGSPTYGIAVGADFVSIVMGGVSKLKVDADGKVTIPGLIDPTGMAFTAVAANPGGALASTTLWCDSGASDALKIGSTKVGDVTGPSVSVDNAITRFDSTTGKIIQESGIYIEDVTAGLAAMRTATGTDLHIRTQSTLSSTPTDDINIDAGAGDSTNEGVITIGATAATGVTIGRSGKTVTVPATLACGAGITRNGLIDDKGQCRVYRNTSAQAVSATTWTKIQFNAETFDTDSYFDSATNYRYLPTKAGKYTVRARLVTDIDGAEWTADPAGQGHGIAVYKNGSAVAYGNVGTDHNGKIAMMVFDEADMNGSTDYLEIFAYSVPGANITNGSTESYASFERVD